MPSREIMYKALNRNLTNTIIPKVVLDVANLVKTALALKRKKQDSPKYSPFLSSVELLGIKTPVSASTLCDCYIINI